MVFDLFTAPALQRHRTHPVGNAADSPVVTLRGESSPDFAPQVQARFYFCSHMEQIARTLSSILPQWFATGKMGNEGRLHAISFPSDTGTAWEVSSGDTMDSVPFQKGSNKSTGCLDIAATIFKAPPYFFVACLLFALP